MTRRVRLSKIAVVRGGFVPSAAASRERKRLSGELVGPPPGSAAEASVPEQTLGILPSAIRADGTIAWEQASPMLPIRGAHRYVIIEGELLLPLRSQKIQAAIARDVPEGMLAVGQWAMLAPDPKEADANYLAWYLNHPRTRSRLAGTMVGTSLQFLTVASVRSFEVELPELDTQRHIGRMAELNARLTQLERQLSTAREKLVDGLAMSAIEHAA